jgi:hypothetical protein
MSGFGEIPPGYHLIGLEEAAALERSVLAEVDPRPMSGTERFGWHLALIVATRRDADDADDRLAELANVAEERSVRSAARGDAADAADWWLRSELLDAARKQLTVLQGRRP